MCWIYNSNTTDINKAKKKKKQLHKSEATQNDHTISLKLKQITDQLKRQYVGIVATTPGNENYISKVDTCDRLFARRIMCSFVT